MLEKDGQPLALSLKSYRSSKVAEVLQQQFKALGVEIKIEQSEGSVISDAYKSGDFTLGLGGLVHPDISLLFAMFHSSMIGVWNSSFVNEPEVDQLISDMLFTASDETHEQAATDLQRHVVEQAYIIPLYTPMVNRALDNRIKDAVFSPITGNLELFDAYIETTVP